MLAALHPTWGALQLAWQALSPLGLVLGGGGLALLAIAALGLVALPGWLSRPAIVAGAVLLVAGLLYQTAYARGTHAAQMRLVKEIALAARQRAEAVEAALAADRTRAAADAARIEALKREIDATPPDPGTCLPAAAARRVRRIQ